MPTERRQRQKEHEKAKKLAAKKAESRKELFRRLWIALGMGGVVVVLLLILNAMNNAEPAQPDGYQAFRDKPTACGAEAPAEQTMDRFPEVADQGLTGPVTVVMTTSCGEMTIELDPALAPESVNAFVFLVRQQAYDGTVFHLLSPDLWVQGGDPDATGRGDLLTEGRTRTRLPDEFPPEGTELEKGMFGLYGDRATRGSGFFVVSGADPPLSARVNVLGRVTDGFATLDAIGAVETGPAGDPAETVYVESVRLAE